MASPIGHAVVGLASAAVVARATGTPSSPELWIGAFVACGAPDLDIVSHFFGYKGPKYHRNATHSLFVIGAVLGAVWLTIEALALGVSTGVFAAWSVALVSHPFLDIATTGPRVAERGYGIPLWWPVSTRRYYIRRPLIESPELDRCETLREMWLSVRPEVYRLGVVSGVVVLLTVLI